MVVRSFGLAWSADGQPHELDEVLSVIGNKSRSSQFSKQRCTSPCVAPGYCQQRSTSYTTHIRLRSTFFPAKSRASTSAPVANTQRPTLEAVIDVKPAEEHASSESDYPIRDLNRSKQYQILQPRPRPTCPAEAFGIVVVTTTSSGGSKIQSMYFVRRKAARQGCVLAVFHTVRLYAASINTVSTSPLASTDLAASQVPTHRPCCQNFQWSSIHPPTPRLCSKEA